MPSKKSIRHHLSLILVNLCIDSRVLYTSLQFFMRGFIAQHTLLAPRHLTNSQSTLLLLITLKDQPSSLPTVILVTLNTLSFLEPPITELLTSSPALYNSRRAIFSELSLTSICASTIVSFPDYLCSRWMKKGLLMVLISLAAICIKKARRPKCNFFFRVSFPPAITTLLLSTQLRSSSGPPTNSHLNINCSSVITCLNLYLMGSEILPFLLRMEVFDLRQSRILVAAFICKMGDLQTLLKGANKNDSQWFSSSLAFYSNVIYSYLHNFVWGVLLAKKSSSEDSFSGYIFGRMFREDLNSTFDDF